MLKNKTKLKALIALFITTVCLFFGMTSVSFVVSVKADTGLEAAALCDGREGELIIQGGRTDIARFFLFSKSGFLSTHSVENNIFNKILNIAGIEVGVHDADNVFERFGYAGLNLSSYGGEWKYLAVDACSPNQEEAFMSEYGQWYKGRFEPLETYSEAKATATYDPRVIQFGMGTGHRLKSVIRDNFLNMFTTIPKMIVALTSVFLKLALGDVAGFVGFDDDTIIRLFTSFHTGFFMPLFIIAIVAVAIYMAWYGIAKKQYAQALSGGLLKSLLLFALAVLLATQPFLLLLPIDLTNGIKALVVSSMVDGNSSDSILCKKGFDGDFTSGVDLDTSRTNTEEMGNRMSEDLSCLLWSEFLFKPWVQAQFGATDFEDLDASKLGNTNGEFVGSPNTYLSHDTQSQNWAILLYSIQTDKHRPVDNIWKPLVSGVNYDYWRVVDAMANVNRTSPGAITQDDPYLRKYENKTYQDYRMYFAFLIEQKSLDKMRHFWTGEQQGSPTDGIDVEVYMEKTTIEQRNQKRQELIDLYTEHGEKLLANLMEDPYFQERLDDALAIANGDIVEATKIFTLTADYTKSLPLIDELYAANTTETGPPITEEHYKGLTETPGWYGTIRGDAAAEYGKNKRETPEFKDIQSYEMPRKHRSRSNQSFSEWLGIRQVVYADDIIGGPYSGKTRDEGLSELFFYTDATNGQLAINGSDTKNTTATAEEVQREAGSIPYYAEFAKKAWPFDDNNALYYAQIAHLTEIAVKIHLGKEITTDDLEIPKLIDTVEQKITVGAYGEAELIAFVQSGQAKKGDGSSFNEGKPPGRTPEQMVENRVWDIERSHNRYKTIEGEFYIVDEERTQPTEYWDHFIGNTQDRAPITIISSIFAIIGVLPTALLSLFSSVYMIGIAIALAVLPIFLLLGILQGPGDRLLRSWAELVVNNGIKSIVTVFLAVLSVYLTSAAMAVANEDSYLKGMLFLVVISIILIRQRKQIANALGNIDFGGNINPAAGLKTGFNKVKGWTKRRATNAYLFGRVFTSNMRGGKGFKQSWKASWHSNKRTRIDDSQVGDSDRAEEARRQEQRRRGEQGQSGDGSGSDSEQSDTKPKVDGYCDMCGKHIVAGESYYRKPGAKEIFCYKCGQSDSDLNKTPERKMGDRF